MTTEEIKNLLASWPGIAVLVTVLVQVAKQVKWIDDKREDKVALLLGVVLAVTAKGSGLMVIGAGWSGWVIAVIGGILAGGVGGQIHDYAWSPAVKMTSSFAKIMKVLIFRDGGKDGGQEGAPK